MTRKEFYKLPFGLYRVRWKDKRCGGVSLAALGNHRDGTRQLYPCNWLGPAEEKHKVWKTIKEMCLLHSVKELNHE